ncbi:hypothetical protein IL54_4396 [Sphingobium sp. ba1]|nr:hypothetical protein IL54_4396 [Sphingobium sp. ba1]
MNCEGMGRRDFDEALKCAAFP